LAPFRINHPIRVAERAAFTDVISNGRMELGLARSGGTEWDAFGVDPDRSRAELREALTVIPKMWMQDSFAWKSDLLVIPSARCCPSPCRCRIRRSGRPARARVVQDGRRARRRRARDHAVHAAREPVDAVRRIPQRTRRVPRAVGAVRNEQISVFTFMHCAATRAEAIASRAAESALWFLNAAPNVFQVPRSLWIDAIRGDLQSSDPRVSRASARPTSRARSISTIRTR
jgi:alkanesulfonate monooxygenase SsuD/methylene tetrahydromethanopterin reductase-like flavin-dependent oxidoreductase (luciferase family)